MPGITELHMGVTTIHWRLICYGAFFPVSTSKFVFQSLGANLVPKAEASGGGCLPFPPIPPLPDSFALFPRQLIYMTLFFPLLLPLALHSSIQSAVV